MKNKESMVNGITAVTNEWIEMTHKTLDLKRIPSIEIRDALRKTYDVLIYYHKDEVIPKALCKMLLRMDEFLYFASIITDNEFEDNPYLFQAIHSISKSLKIGFFKGEYESEYPILKIKKTDKNIVDFDLQNGCIEDLF